MGVVVTSLAAHLACAQPVPLIRDLSTGYLLDCSFLSPRPYCWTNDDCLLSGWEVERTGGYFAFQPNCRYPEGFGFHSDWFMLVDTNAQAAVTLAHQVARQTNGRVTLEFRFRLSAPMDGVCWQLRDLKAAGLSLITTNGGLWLGTPGQKWTRLGAVRHGREYGVKVVADLDDKRVDVLVDGELRARCAPLAESFRAMDYFLVQTGAESMGDLFLNPVQIHKGYAVNETFVTCGVGGAPADWRVSGAAVAEFECATKPDIYSLKLAGATRREARASKRFPPLRDPTIFEFRCLFPDAREGAGAGLFGGGKGVRIATVRGDLCLLDATSRPIPLAPGFRTNFWYMIKVVADPPGGTSDVFINGKQVVTRAKTHPGVKAFDAVRFETSRQSALWVDDVKVHPRRSYPSDYPPAPEPVATKDDLLLGVQSCNLWREGTAYAGWDYVRPYRSRREPYLGWYDEGNPEETDWEIKWQVEHGIGFEQHCWYRPNNAVGRPIKDGVLDHGIIKGFFNARYRTLRKFTIMYTNEGAGETNPADWREHIIPYWIEYFFKDPQYLKIEGKPVLAIYHLGHFERMFGGVEGAREAIRTLRDQVTAAGFPGLWVLMEDRTAKPENLVKMKSLGVDYCYAYTWGTPDATVQRNMNSAQRDAAAQAGIRSLTSLSMGWDREAWGVREGGWLPVGDYEALADWARDEFLPTLPAGSLGRRMVMLANWNEFGEGHFLMPSSLAGFGYLDALRAVFTSGGAHEDARPTENQKRRFTVLYPRE